MKTKIDLKSALFGLAAGVLLTFTLAAASPQPSGIGRYQVGGTGNHGLVVDTVTGQVWSGYFQSNGGKTDHDFFLPKAGDKK